MTYAGPQYEFTDGHWRDRWNDIADDTGQPVAGQPWAHAILGQLFCGCTDLDPYVRWMRDYLRGEWGRAEVDDTYMIGYETDTPLHEIIANLADHLGFTEHGGTIRWAWLEDAGTRWLELCARSA